jgi:hypothetical protein
VVELHADELRFGLDAACLLQWDDAVAPDLLHGLPEQQADFAITVGRVLATWTISCDSVWSAV